MILPLTLEQESEKRANVIGNDEFFGAKKYLHWRYGLDIDVL